MSLLVAATEAGLIERIRNRIAEGAPVREVPVADAPAWLVAEADGAPLRACFQSPHAHVAVLEDGRTIVRRARA